MSNKTSRRFITMSVLPAIQSTPDIEFIGFREPRVGEQHGRSWIAVQQSARRFDKLRLWAVRRHRICLIHDGSNDFCLQTPIQAKRQHGRFQTPTLPATGWRGSRSGNGLAKAMIQLLRRPDRHVEAAYDPVSAAASQSGTQSGTRNPR